MGRCSAVFQGTTADLLCLCPLPDLARSPEYCRWRQATLYAPEHCIERSAVQAGEAKEALAVPPGVVVVQGRLDGEG